jgi:hypothetical protein
MVARRMGPAVIKKKAPEKIKVRTPLQIVTAAAKRKVAVTGKQRAEVEREQRLKAKRNDSGNPAGVKLPNAERAEKGLSLTALLRKQPAFIRSSGEDIIIKKYKDAKTKKGAIAFTGVCVDGNKRPATPHKFEIIGTDPGQPYMSKQKRIKVSCSCEFFMYRCEYALWTWGAANIKYSNGMPAKVTNPSNFPLVCKHIQSVMTLIKSRED